jgi:hypothetical protein
LETSVPAGTPRHGRGGLVGVVTDHGVVVICHRPNIDVRDRLEEWLITSDGQPHNERLAGEALRHEDQIQAA